MAGIAVGLSIAFTGLVTGAIVGLYIATRWVAGVLAGITGGFGGGALCVSGYGDIDLLSLVGAITVCGVLVGLAAMVSAHAMTHNLRRRDKFS
jgi:hypothetical protein